MFKWAHIVIFLERSFSPDDLKKFQDQYCIKLKRKQIDDKTEETIFALNVIQKVLKSKAGQMLDYKRNWKVFVINYLFYYYFI